MTHPLHYQETKAATAVQLTLNKGVSGGDDFNSCSSVKAGRRLLAENILLLKRKGTKNERSHVWMPRFSGRLRELNHGGSLPRKDWLGCRYREVVAYGVFLCIIFKYYVVSVFFYFLSLIKCRDFILLINREWGHCGEVSDRDLDQCIDRAIARSILMMYWPSDSKVNTSLT